MNKWRYSKVNFQITRRPNWFYPEETEKTIPETIGGKYRTTVSMIPVKEIDPIVAKWMVLISWKHVHYWIEIKTSN